MSATGIVEANTYFAEGDLMGEEFSAILVPASTPLIGKNYGRTCGFGLTRLPSRLRKCQKMKYIPSICCNNKAL